MVRFDKDSIIKCAIIIAVVFLLIKLGILKYIGLMCGTLVYLFIGFLISMFADDSPNEWLAERPRLLTAVHIAIIFLWLPIAVVLVVWILVEILLRTFGLIKPDKQTSD